MNSLTTTNPNQRPRRRFAWWLIPVVIVIAAAIAAAVWLLSYDSRAAAFDAARKGDLSKLKFALSLQPGLLRETGTGLILMRQAAEQGNGDVADFLMSRGVAIDVPGPGEETLLLEAVRAGRADMVRFLAERRADLDAQSPRGETPLMLAIASCRADIAQYLLDRKASTADPGQPGRTVLDREWPQHAYHVVRLLLERNVDADPYYLLAPLALALEHGDKTLVQSYLSAYPSMNRPSRLRNTNGATLLHLAVEQRKYDLARLLLAQGANPSARDERKRTVLDAAVEGGPAAFEIIRPLLAGHAAASVDRLYTALDMALAAGEKTLVESYVTALPNMSNLRDAKGQSLLHYAAACGNVAAADLLLDRGADVNAWSWQGMAPLHLAVTAPRAACETAALLIARKADVNAPDLFERTPLYLAVLNGASIDVIKILLDAGAKVEARCCDKYAPIHRAMAAGRKDVVRLLISYKANVNAQDPTGKTLMHYAAADGDKDMVEFLMANKASCNMKDYSGARPIRYAIQNGHSDVAELLSPQTEKRPPKK